MQKRISSHGGIRLPLPIKLSSQDYRVLFRTYNCEAIDYLYRVERLHSSGLEWGILASVAWQ